MKLIRTTLCLFSAMSLCTSAYARDITVTSDGKAVTVTAAAEAGAAVMLSVIADGRELSEYDHYAALEEGTASSDGKVEFTFNMPDEVNGAASDGKYIIYIKEDGAPGFDTAEFYYTSPAAAAKLRAELAAAKTAAQLAAVADNDDNYISLAAEGFEMELYGSLSASAKSAALARTAARAGSAADISAAALAEIFNEETAVAAVNGASSEAAVKAALLSVDPGFEDVSFGETAETELGKWIVKCIYKNKTYESYTALCNEYASANALYKINNAKFGELAAVISEYADTLGIAGNSTYTKYKSNKSASINRTIAEKLSSSPATDAAGLIAVIAECLPAESGTSGGGGSSGGGGGGGVSYGSGSSGALAITAPTEAPQENSGGQREPSTISEGYSFPDMAQAAWAEPAVKAARELGIIDGDGNGNFRPNDKITREEFVKLIVTAAGLYDEAAQSEFGDVPQSAWYYSYVSAAVAAGIITGVSDTEFGSGLPLLRQDMAVIAKRAVIGGVSAVREDIIFADEAEISDYAKADIHALYSAGLINGMDGGMFAPRETATRAQAAQMIYNLFVEGR